MGAAISQSQIPRSEFFVVTKIHPRDLGYEATRKAVEDSLARLNTDYIDGLLLHYSHCFEPVCTRAELQRTQKAGGWKQSWRAMNELLREGKVRAIGLSNFDINTLQSAQPAPHIVQNWMDPFHQDREVWDWCRVNGIAFMAYSALGGQWIHQRTQDSKPRSNPIDSSPTLRDIAEKHGSSPQEIVLRWALQRRAVIIPRSSNPAHIQQNAIFLDLESPSFADNMLTAQEMEQLDGLDGIVDDHSLCSEWASTGECQANPSYMLSSCKSACLGQGVKASSPHCVIRPSDIDDSEL